MIAPYSARPVRGHHHDRGRHTILLGTEVDGGIAAILAQQMAHHLVLCV